MQQGNAIAQVAFRDADPSAKLCDAATTTTQTRPQACRAVVRSNAHLSIPVLREDLMLKDHHQFSCPCCGKLIELDTKTGKARAVAKDGKRDLDDLLSAQQRDEARLGDAFDQARSKQQRESEHLDDLLNKAKKDARDNPDEKIRRPFDLD